MKNFQSDVPVFRKMHELHGEVKIRLEYLDMKREENERLNRDLGYGATVCTSKDSIRLD